MGVKSGIPDICLPYPRGKYHGMYIELKRESGGTLSAEQKTKLSVLVKYGYHAIAAHGWEEAAKAIVEYLKLGNYRCEMTDYGAEELPEWVKKGLERVKEK